MALNTPSGCVWLRIYPTLTICWVTLDMTLSFTSGLHLAPDQWHDPMVDVKEGAGIPPRRILWQSLDTV